MGGDDCNDNVTTIHPFAPEDADTTDDNCDNIESTRHFLLCWRYGHVWWNGQILCSVMSPDKLHKRHSSVVTLAMMTWHR